MLSGVTAVLGAAAVPPIVITRTVGTGRFNRALNVIEIDPKVLTWPTDCQRFLGAHEAAHSQQQPLARRWARITLLILVVAYAAISTAGAVKYGLGNQFLELITEATICLGLLLLAMIEAFLLLSRRQEYAADRAAVAAVGALGMDQMRNLSQSDLTTSTRAMLALNAAIGLRTHPTWRRRIAAATRMA